MGKVFDKEFIVDALALVAIGCVSLGYLLYWNVFAEVHIQFSFFDFPVFVGEILLTLCFLLLLIKWRLKPIRFTKWHLLILCYGIFVLSKAFIGYLEWGPLALRHAALHYYPIFILFGYYFYRRDFFNVPVCTLIILIFLLIFYENNFGDYYLFMCSALGLVLVRSLPNKYLRLFLLVALLVLIPYPRFIYTARMMILSNLVSVLFLVVLLFSIRDMVPRRKMVLGVVVFILMTIGITFCFKNEGFRSIFMFREMYDMYVSYDKRIADEKGSFQRVESEEIKFYNPNEEKMEALGFKTFKKLGRAGDQLAENIHFGKSDMATNDTTMSNALQEPLHLEVDTSESQYQSKTSIGTGLFRILIWRDMIVDFVKTKPIFGFDYGKPFRSISIEIFKMGYGEWTRDGWVEAHNSYLHLIYRSGIIGLAFICSIFILFYRMIRIFVLHRSWVGLLLCSCLINWFVAANLLLIFELPYTAIPVWSLFGMTLAYCRQLPQGEIIKI